MATAQVHPLVSVSAQCDPIETTPGPWSGDTPAFRTFMPGPITYTVETESLDGERMVFAVGRDDALELHRLIELDPGAAYRLAISLAA